MAMTLQQAGNKLAATYQSNTGKTKAFDWAAIIKMVMDLISSCSTKNAKANVKDHPVAFQVIIKRHLITGNVVPRGDAGDVSEACVDTFNGISVNNVQAVRDEIGV